MKTIILWKRKRTRTFKQVGLATADSSACTIRGHWLMAAKGEGTLAVVDASNVMEARTIIDNHLHGHPRGQPVAGVVMHALDDRVLALGARAVLAIAGASEAIRHWDARLARDGKVRVQDTTALGPRSDAATFTTADAFGEGFKPPMFK
jgi:hypothetical protein